MFKKLVIFFLIPIGALLFLTLFIEFGFELRRKIETSFAPPQQQQQTQILFIGDSILGFLSDQTSLASQIEKQLKEKATETIEAAEISKPALRTPQALEQVRKITQGSPPNIVILMLGKSDYIHESSPWNSPLSRFRLFRLLEYAYLNTKDLIFRTQQRWLQDLTKKAQPAWDFYGQARYKEAIPLFEDVIKEGYHNPRVLRALLSCYIIDHQFERGIAYFQQIKDTHTDKDLVQRAIEILSNHPKNPNRQDRPVLQTQFTLDTRDHLRFQMWMYKLQNKAEDMMTVFQKLPPESSAHISAYTRNNLVEILNSFSPESTHIFVLQYPMDHLSALQRTLPSRPKNVTFIDLRSLLLKASPEQFINFWQEDIEHLSFEGNAWISQKIAPIILNPQRGNK